MAMYLSLAGVLGALLLGAMSPGPSFVLVARTAVAITRADGIAAALGMGVGAMIFSVAVLLGLQTALSVVPWFYLALKLAGGLYLVYLATRIWRNARQPFALTLTGSPMAASPGKSFLTGLLTQLSNPKTAVVYGGIFAALLPHHLPRAAVVLLPVLVFLVEAGWYCVVAYALSSNSSRDTYLRSKHYVDRTAGGMMGLLGVKIIASTHSPT